MITDPLSPLKRGRGRPPKNAAGIPYSQCSQDNPNIITRDFLCTICGKTYLSNPALYLHMKVKHIQENNQMVNGEYKRGRGRPKKNVSFVLMIIRVVLNRYNKCE
jgi:hypothetical protein